MNRVVVIANPVASQFTGGAHRTVMAALSRHHDVEPAWPGSAAEATVHARAASEGGAAMVVAMGGDGMVHHVAQGLVGTTTPLAVVPVGTTNVVARLLGLPGRVRKAARVAADPSTGSGPVGVVRIDMGRAGVETTRFALFALGFGFDAEVVAAADADVHRKYRFGAVHYARSALEVALRTFPASGAGAVVRAGGREARAAAVMVQFRAVYTYFGRLPLKVSSAHPDPLTVLALGSMPRWRIPSVVTRLLGGRDLAPLAGIEVWTGLDRLRLESSPPIAAQADGESLGTADWARVEWVPGALSVVGAGQSP